MQSDVPSAQQIVQNAPHRVQLIVPLPLQVVRHANLAIVRLVQASLKAQQESLTIVQHVRVQLVLHVSAQPLKMSLRAQHVSRVVVLLVPPLKPLPNVPAVLQTRYLTALLYVPTALQARYLQARYLTALLHVPAVLQARYLTALLYVL